MYKDELGDQKALQAVPSDNDMFQQHLTVFAMGFDLAADYAVTDTQHLLIFHTLKLAVTNVLSSAVIFRFSVFVVVF